jgi:hypothetical protein
MRMIPRKAVPGYLQETHGVRFSVTSLARWASQGGGPVYRRVGRYTYYEPKDIDRWLRKKMTPPLRWTSDFPIRPNAKTTAKRPRKLKAIEPNIFDSAS